jgi:hypothetical protein
MGEAHSGDKDFAFKYIYRHTYIRNLNRSDLANVPATDHSSVMVF